MTVRLTLLTCAFVLAGTACANGADKQASSHPVSNEQGQFPAGNSFLVIGEDRALLFDTGLGGRQLEIQGPTSSATQRPLSDWPSLARSGVYTVSLAGFAYLVARQPDLFVILTGLDT